MVELEREATDNDGHGLVTSKPAQQSAEEEKDETILGQAIFGETPSWVVWASDGGTTGKSCICFQGPVVQSVVKELVKGHFVNCFSGFNIQYSDIFC